MIALGPFLVLIIIVFTLWIDYFWLDRESKRWGWIKGWSSKNKVLFFIGFIAVSSMIYLVLSNW